MGQKLKIRTFESKDLNKLYALSNELSDTVKVERTILEKHIDFLIEDDRHQILVAEKDNIVIGYLSANFHTAIYANGKVAYIDEIVIAKENRGKGIGTLLLKAFEQMAKRQKCILVSLASGGAKEFYEKAGYASKASYFKKYL